MKYYCIRLIKHHSIERYSLHAHRSFVFIACKKSVHIRFNEVNMHYLRRNRTVNRFAFTGIQAKKNLHIDV